MTDSLRIGSFVVELAGDSPVRALVAEELGTLLDPRAAPDLRVVLTRDGPPEPPVEATIVGDVAATEERAWIRCTPEAWTMVVDRGVDPPLVTVHQPGGPEGRLTGIRHRALNRTFLRYDEQDAYLFIHFILEFLVLLFAEDVTFIHSSAVSRDGEALMLVSTGGTGKTSGAAELIGRHGWSFLSDDMTPVTADGEVVAWPRRVMIYPYNVAGAPVFRRRVLAGRTPLDLLHWEVARRVRGEKGPRRRVAAEQLFGADAVGSDAPVRWALFLSRWGGDDFRLEPTDAKTLAARSRHILVVEFGAPLRWLHEWAATGHCPIEPREMLDRQEALMAQGLGRAAEHHDLKIPHHIRPPDLAGYLNALCTA